MRPFWTTSLLASAAWLAACSGTRSAPPEAPPTAAVAPDPADSDAVLAAGRAVLVRHECTRCHRIDDLPAASRPRDCISCHQFLKTLPPDDPRYAKITAKIGKPVMDRYQAKIVHLLDVPDLTGVGHRLRPDWIGTYLEAPFDVRPALQASMIRTRLTAEERQALVRYFAVAAGRPDPATTRMEPEVFPAHAPPVIAQGEALFKTRGCIVCHTFGNVPTGMTAAILEANPTAKLAPNLRFTKDRMDFETAVAWIVDPASVWPEATMPAFGVSRDDAEKIATWLWYADPALQSAPEVTATLPPAVDHPVGWAEVKEEVLGHVCVHCHMNHYEKDPGPGNLGGLGYPGLKLEMRTYEALVAGYSNGNALVGVDGAHPPMLDAMLTRRLEAPRDQVPAFADHVRPPYPERLGMPMGLPAMNDTQFGILRAWIEQGCPGPTEVTGLPGSDDGFLVPDGPIPDNDGCHLRPRTQPRPAWAVDQEAF